MDVSFKLLSYTKTLHSLYEKISLHLNVQYDKLKIFMPSSTIITSYHPEQGGLVSLNF